MGNFVHGVGGAKRARGLSTGDESLPQRLAVVELRGVLQIEELLGVLRR